MEEVKRARDALAASIFAAVKEFERDHPGAFVDTIIALHEKPMTVGPVSEIRVEVRL